MLNWISILALLLAISSIQWGVSTGEELNGKASNSRPQRRTYYYYYSYNYYYSYTYYNLSDSSSLAYMLMLALSCLCVCFTPCIIIGIITCVAICITGAASSSSHPQPTHITTTQTIPNPTQQPYYAYPQPVQTHGYFPPGLSDMVKAPCDALPPSYQTILQDNQNPN